MDLSSISTASELRSLLASTSRARLLSVCLDQGLLISGVQALDVPASSTHAVALELELCVAPPLSQESLAILGVH